jgi:1,4-dihydroxy-2-naphthoate octaprenyltransferase
MAYSAGREIDLAILVWGQIAVTAIQLMTHYCNDYFDYLADCANTTPTQWSGGSRVLPASELSPRVALWTALALAGVALVAAFVLRALQPAPYTLPLIGLALVGAWSYSAPPLRLHSRGLGEVSAALLVAGLTPIVGYYLQTGDFARVLLPTVAPLVLLQFNMLLAINFPDAAGDAAAGKRTLVILLGAANAARLYGLVVAATYLLLLSLIFYGLPPGVALASLLPLPLALWLARRMRRGAWRDSAQWNSLGFWSLGLMVLTAVLQLLVYALFGAAVPTL